MHVIGHDYPLVQANSGKMDWNLLPALRDNLADLRKLRLVINNPCQPRLLVVGANGDEEKASESVIVTAQPNRSPFLLIGLHIVESGHGMPLLLFWI
jgi:hypothetical protein